METELPMPAAILANDPLWFMNIDISPARFALVLDHWAEKVLKANDLNVPVEEYLHCKRVLQIKGPEWCQRDVEKRIDAVIARVGRALCDADNEAKQTALFTEMPDLTAGTALPNGTI